MAVGWSATPAGRNRGRARGGLARLGRRGVVLALLVGPPLFAVSAGGNVQSLMVLALLVGFHRRWGPLAVAAAASMKIAPILLVAAYVARREWGRAALSLGLTAALMIPSVLMGITDAGVRSEAAPSLLGISPIVYGIAVVGALVATFLVARRYAVTGAAVATVLALPRLFVYDVSLVAIGAAPSDDEPRPAQGAPKSPKPGASI